MTNEITNSLPRIQPLQPYWFVEVGEALYTCIQVVARVVAQFFSQILSFFVCSERVDPNSPQELSLNRSVEVVPAQNHIDLLPNEILIKILNYVDDYPLTSCISRKFMDLTCLAQWQSITEVNEHRNPRWPLMYSLCNLLQHECPKELRSWQMMMNEDVDLYTLRYSGVHHCEPPVYTIWFPPFFPFCKSIQHKYPKNYFKSKIKQIIPYALSRTETTDSEKTSTNQLDKPHSSALIRQCESILERALSTGKKVQALEDRIEFVNYIDAEEIKKHNVKEVRFIWKAEMPITPHTVRKELEKVAQIPNIESRRTIFAELLGWF